MNPQAEALKARTKKFALDVLAFVKTLPRDDDVWTIRTQLTDAGTSVGANYRAACRARSRAEFVAKIGVVLEEADESSFWLEVIREGEIPCSQSALQYLLTEANELTAIFAASSITARSS